MDWWFGFGLMMLAQVWVGLKGKCLDPDLAKIHKKIRV